MIEFYINGQQVEVQIEDEQTIGDVLRSFEATCEENQAAVIGITVDGKQITAELFDEEAQKPLSSDTKFEFSIVTKDEIKASFAKLSELFAELASQMEGVPVALQSGKNLEVSESIKKLADSIDQFCHIAGFRFDHTHLAQDAHLRRSNTDPFRLAHGFDHIIQKFCQSVIELDDLSAFLSQYFVAFNDNVA